MDYSKENRERILKEILELCQTTEQVRFLSQFNYEANVNVLNEAEMNVQTSRAAKQAFQELILQLFETQMRYRY